MTDMVIGIDPGSEKSALVIWDGRRVDVAVFAPNEIVADHAIEFALMPRAACVIESMSGYGMTMGQELIDTLIWIGRLAQIWEHRSGQAALLIPRREIKLHHCETVRAGDSHIKQALEAKYGKPGTRKQPGLMYPLKSSHLRSAFAVATYVTERRARQQLIPGEDPETQCACPDCRRQREHAP